MFGRSAFGGGLGKDSPFASKTQPAESTTPKETPPGASSNAFSAFGGSVSAFGKVGGGSAGKSFSEMLKEGGGDKDKGKDMVKKVLRDCQMAKPPEGKVVHQLVSVHGMCGLV